MEKDLISIVVPVYNAAKFIDNTIKTVLDQTYENWELLLAYDCSDENTAQLIKPYTEKDSRIKFIPSPEKTNTGPGPTRNRGIDEAKGDYLAFLDADDFWHPEKLERQLAFVKKKGCEFCFTGYEFANEEGKLSGKKVYVPEKYTYDEVLHRTIIWTATVMFDMHKLTKEDIYMPDARAEDTACWLQVLKKIDYAYGLNEILAYYRRSKGTYSSNKLLACKKIWSVYRDTEKLSLPKSISCFTAYAINAVKRRI